MNQQFWLESSVFICNRLQLFWCCFYIASKAKSTVKLVFSIKSTKNFLLFHQTFFIMSKISQFFCWEIFLIFFLADICLWLKQHSKISENRSDCLEIADKNRSLSVIELFTFAVYFGFISSLYSANCNGILRWVSCAERKFSIDLFSGSSIHTFLSKI